MIERASVLFNDRSVSEIMLRKITKESSDPDEEQDELWAASLTW